MVSIIIIRDHLANIQNILALEHTVTSMANHRPRLLHIQVMLEGLVGTKMYQTLTSVITTLFLSHLETIMVEAQSHRQGRRLVTSAWTNIPWPTYTSSAQGGNAPVLVRTARKVSFPARQMHHEL